MADSLHQKGLGRGEFVSPPLAGLIHNKQNFSESFFEHPGDYLYF